MRRTDLMLSLLFYVGLIVGVMYAGQVFATAAAPTQGQSQGQSQLQGQGQAQSQATTIGIGVDTRAAAAAFAGGGQGGNAAASSGGATSANTLTINEASVPSSIRVRNTPDTYSPTIYPTAPCMGSTSTGGSGPGFGVSFGTSWESEECQIGETARGFEAAGYREDAMAVRCQGRFAKVAPSCRAYQ